MDGATLGAGTSPSSARRPADNQEGSMTWLRLTTSLASCSLLLGCGEPTAPQRAEPRVLGVSRAVNPNAACYPVRFHSDDERFGADPTTIIGEFSGDIQGTFTAGVDLS